MNADISVSVSGIAGPGGGMPEKPVGTTWVGLVTPEGELAQLFHFSSGDREKNKVLAVEAALQLLLDYLQDE
jgi:nicotinamide mononucleotide (NMN) deamidase PncC